MRTLSLSGMVALLLSKREVGFNSPSRSKRKENKMLVIVKERGDISEKIGILQIDDEHKEITIIKHPNFNEGDTCPITVLNSLIKSMKGTK